MMGIAGSDTARVNLDLRGKRFELQRGALLDLPESVLLYVICPCWRVGSDKASRVDVLTGPSPLPRLYRCLFPNGVNLNSDEGMADDEVFYIDVSHVRAVLQRARSVLVDRGHDADRVSSDTAVRRAMSRLSPQVL